MGCKYCTSGRGPMRINILKAVCPDKTVLFWAIILRYFNGILIRVPIDFRNLT